MLHEAHLARTGNKNDYHKDNTNSSSSSSSSSNNSEHQNNNTFHKDDNGKHEHDDNANEALRIPECDPVRYGLKSRAALDVAERHVLALHSKLVALEFHRNIQNNDTPRACSACKILTSFATHPT